MMHTFKPIHFRSFLSKRLTNPNPFKNDRVQTYGVPFRRIKRSVKVSMLTERFVLSDQLQKNKRR